MKRTLNMMFVALVAVASYTIAGKGAGLGHSLAPAPVAAGRRGPRRRNVIQIGKRVFSRALEDRIMAEAAGVTFYTLLALFPAIAALISLYGLVADPETIEAHLSMLGGVVPGGGMQIITEQVHSLASTKQSALGLGAAFGILVSLWSTSAGIRALFDALNAVYEEPEKRGFVRRVLISLAFTIGGIAFVALTVTGVVALPIVLDYAGWKSSTDLLLRLLRWPVLLAAITFMLGLIYRFGPCDVCSKFRWLSWGSGFAAIAWLAASAGFSWYAANFGSYNKTYGSLGAAVGFMTWIWISTIILLAGAEVNAEMEQTRSVQ